MRFFKNRNNKLKLVLLIDKYEIKLKNIDVDYSSKFLKETIDAGEIALALDFFITQLYDYNIRIDKNDYLEIVELCNYFFVESDVILMAKELCSNKFYH